jgi:hypothetical protein
MRSWRSLGLLAAMVLVLVACGGGSESTTAEETEESSRVRRRGAGRAGRLAASAANHRCVDAVGPGSEGGGR